MSRLANTIEAILYLKAQPLKIAQIAEFAKCDKESAEEGLIELMGEYAHREGALEIAETEEGYALQLRELYKPLVDSIVPLDIGLGALRTLAAIALRGPIAQSELVDLRGSGVYQHVPDLVEQGFVKKRRQSDGRSSWLQITEKFYQHFQIDKLPEIKQLSLPTPIKGSDEETLSADTADAADAADTPKVNTASPKEDPGKTQQDEAVLSSEPEESGPEKSGPEKSGPEESTVDNEGDGDEITPEMAEEIAVLSGAKAPSASNALLSDAALEEVLPSSSTPETMPEILNQSHSEEDTAT